MAKRSTKKTKPATDDSTLSDLLESGEASEVENCAKSVAEALENMGCSEVESDYRANVDEALEAATALVAALQALKAL